MMKISPQTQASVLVESLPYIQKFHNEIVVVKYGGSAMSNRALKEGVLRDIALMKYVGINPVIVHGGGPEITEMMQRYGKKATFIDGLRVTDEKTMELTEMVLSGKIASEIVALLGRNGVKSIGISGKDGQTILAKAKSPDLGLVGTVETIQSDLLMLLIREGYVPVISPIGVDEQGARYNINADEVAGALAAALGAKKLVLMTDVSGVLRDASDPNTRISEIKIDEVDHYIKQGIVTGGMIPKVGCCVSAIEKGVQRCHIIDGKKSHAILLEIFTDDGVGTLIQK
ncbi:MAG: acetylglutamate kinase [Clostridiales bacterium]|jgi:acetylglutamate kinase|nr:acetylglutamate kinase [Clostridiales bacterium]